MMPLLGFLDRVVPLLWRATWQAGVLIALIFVIRAMLGSRLAPVWRFALWGVVLVRLLVPVLPSGPLSLFRFMAYLGPVRANAFGMRLSQPSRVVPTAASAQPLPPPLAPAVLSEAPGRFLGIAGAPTRSQAKGADGTFELVRTPVRIAGFVWLAGVLFLSVRTTIGGARLQRRRSGWRKPDDPRLAALFAECQATIGVRFSVVLWETPDDLGPAVAGLWAPCVLVPQSVLASASREDIEHILLHELAHVRRRDLGLHWLMTAARVVHWFNPTVQLAAARMQADRELACDADVLRLLGRERRNAYGVTILKMAGRLVSPWPLPGLVGVFGPQQDLQERIIMIANFKPIRRGWNCVAATLLLAFAVTGLTDAANVAPDDEPPGAKNTVPKVPAETKKDAGSTVQPQAPKDREGAQPSPKRVTELIAVLRAAKYGDVIGNPVTAPWARAIRDLVAIGRPTVPALIEELDRTTEQWPLRTLGFTLRAIGDPRAVSALIRAIPRTLLEPVSDFGLTLDDAELLAFMQRHDLDPGDTGQDFIFGRPFREITGALHTITGQKFNEDELNFVTLAGGSPQRRIQRQHFQQLAERWAMWWIKNRRRFMDDPAYDTVKLSNLLEPPGRDVVAAQPFPTGAKVRAGSGTNMNIGPPQTVRDARTFMDLDAGRSIKWPDELPAPEKAKPDDVAIWAAREGYDLRGIEYRPPGSDKSYYALQGFNLHLWQIDNRRYNTIEGELRGDRAPELGRPAGDLLMDFDPQTGTYHPENEATFLFVTRDGATGVLQVINLITDLIVPSDIGQPIPIQRTRGSYRGVQFQYKLLYEEGKE
ncbi:M56 family metallopeptidase [Singulisphaera sp. Ch08]|uniref:M56 family metallopeptidase n=1 Tax=Singulisphaera sp. Ch08 TaxID=3120278 RepID=A0AAU7CL53_9BACT